MPLFLALMQWKQKNAQMEATRLLRHAPKTALRDISNVRVANASRPGNGLIILGTIITHCVMDTSIALMGVTKQRLYVEQTVKT